MFKTNRCSCEQAVPWRDDCTHIEPGNICRRTSFEPTVDRYTSHETFSRHFDFMHTSHCGSRCPSVHIHSICMSSMMSRVFERSLASTFSLSVYLFSVLHIHFHNVESAEDYTQCAPARWGVLHHGDAQPSHTDRTWGHSQHLCALQHRRRWPQSCWSH